jgi:hypothetical protein
MVGHSVFAGRFWRSHFDANHCAVSGGNTINSSIIKLIRSAFLSIGIFVLVLPYGHAEPDTRSSPLTEKHLSIYLGGFFPRVSSTIRLDADIDGGISDVVSLEDTLGLEKGEAVFWGGLVWQMSRRNLLEFEYFQLNRSGSVDAVTEPFQIGNSLVQAGAQTDTTFDVDIGRVTYGFFFVSRERLNVAVKGGLHWLKLDAEIKLSGAVVDIETDEVIEAGSSVTEGGAIGAPLPHVGFSLSYAITPKLLARAQTLVFGASIEDYSGLLIDAYMPIKHFGVGGGLRYFDLRLEADIDRLSGEFEYQYWGPTLFILGNF